MSGAFSSLAFSSPAFDVVTVATTGTNVFDDPDVVGQNDFDSPTNFGGVYFIARPARAEIVVQGFTSVGLTRGFAVTPTRADVVIQGFSGGLVSGLGSLNAITGVVTVQGNWPGTQGKPGGLLDNASDPDGDPLSFEILSLPIHGTLQVEFNSAFLYVPTRGFSGLDSFTWRPWANGEAGNAVVVTLVVEEDRLALSGELTVAGFAPTLSGIGLFAPAIRGDIDVTGFVSVGLQTAFAGQPTRAEVVAQGFVPTLPPGLQALEGDVEVVGFAPGITAGWINRATAGAVDPAGLAGTLSIGFVSQATLGAVEVVGFASANIGFVAQASLAQVTVTGFASHYLERPLQALLGEAGPVTGFVPALLDYILLPPTTPERPSDVVYYNPRDHLPAGQILDRETDDVLMAYWASVDYRPLTDTEMAILCGDPLPIPVIKRSFPTGEYPVKKTGTY